MSIKGFFSRSWKIRCAAALALAKSGAKEEDCPMFIAANTITEYTLRIELGEWKYSSFQMYFVYNTGAFI